MADDGALEERLLREAARGKSEAFEQLAVRYRRELYAHCYRMLGSVHDAEDALQEAMLAAWRGMPGFEGRSSLRAWLYRVTTNACLRVIARQPPRMRSPDLSPARRDVDDLGEPVAGPVWLEPWLDDEPVAEAREDDPVARALERESVELAFVAALQHLPATQRAVLLMREVLGFSAAEAASILETSPASVNSALQRARQTVDERVPAVSQQAELDALGVDGTRALVNAFVAAWERADVSALLSLLAHDARFTMPPLPAWFDGRDDVGRFLGERVFASTWRLVSVTANQQVAFACYSTQSGSSEFRLAALNLLAIRGGRVAEITGFIDPELLRRLDLPQTYHSAQR